MSNDISASPLIIDTVGSPVAILVGYVGTIYWYSPTTIGHEAVVQDENDRDLAHFKCEAANQSQLLRVDRLVHELNVPTLGSGVLYIYMEIIR